MLVVLLGAAPQPLGRSARRPNRYASTAHDGVSAVSSRGQQRETTARRADAALRRTDELTSLVKIRAQFLHAKRTRIGAGRISRTALV